MPAELWIALSGIASTTTVAGDEIVQSTGPSAGIQVMAWIVPLGIVVLAVCGLRRIEGAQ